jgi:uncharacterized caspase-like protein
MDSSNLKRDEQLKREAAIEELERISILLDSDPERIEALSHSEVAEELREMGLNPHQSLPPDILAIISGDQQQIDVFADGDVPETDVSLSGLLSPEGQGHRYTDNKVLEFQSRSTRFWEATNMTNQTRIILALAAFLLIGAGLSVFVLSGRNGPGPQGPDSGSRGIGGSTPPPVEARVVRIEEARRVALVIGNKTYEHPPLLPLKNPVNDAEDMAAALSDLQFVVTVKTEISDKKEMDAIVRSWSSSIQPNDVALFYYAGHGAQYDRSNFLFPISMRYEKESDIEEQGESFDAVMRSMSDQRALLNIIILDTCRNEIAGKSVTSRNVQDAPALARGLAVVSASSETYIAFATAPGQVTSDGPRRNGLFTEYLLKHIKAPGVNIEQMFKLVRQEVLKDEYNQGRRQEPWDASSMTGDFYFNRGQIATLATAPAPPPSQTSGNGRPDTLEAIIKRYQAKKVKESCSQEACCCFTEIDLRNFIDDEVPDQVTSELRGDQQFLRLAADVGRMALDERERLLNRTARIAKQTWAERVEISCEGQTVAGQRAERMIAKAVVDLVREIIR